MEGRPATCTMKTESALGEIPLPPLPELCLAITERAPLPMATVEGATHIVRYGNPAFCTLMGKSLAELVGRPLDTLLPHKDQAVTLVDRVYRTKKPVSYTEQEPTKPHPVFWSYTIWPVLANEGLVGIMIQITETAEAHGTTVAMNEALVLGSLRQHELTEQAEKLNELLEAEIVERKRTEAVLRVSEERYRTLFDSIDEGFCIIELIYDPKGRPFDYIFVDVNPAFEKQSGILGGKGKRIREINPDPEMYWLEMYGRVAETGIPSRYSNEMKGLNRWFDVYAFRLGEADSRKVAILFTNITASKRAVDQLRLLWEAAAVLLSTNDPNAILRGLLAKIGPVLQLDTYFHYLVDETGGALRLASCAGVPPKTTETIARLEFGHTISGTVAQHHRSIYVPAVQRSTDPKTGAIRSFGLRAYVCYPLMAGRETLGTLSYGSRTRDEFDPDELAVLQTIAHYVAVAFERLLTANALRVSETRYRRLFEAAHDGVLLLDPATRKITDANPFMTELLGYSHTQLVGKELFEIGLLKDEKASQEMFRKLKRRHEVRYEDLPLESRRGRHQEVEVVANLYQENGHAVIQCNIRDITARKKADDALRQSEARFRTLFELGPIAVYSCDATGVVQNCNVRAVELWGRSPTNNSKGKRYSGAYRLYRPDGRFLSHSRSPMAAVLNGKLTEVHDHEMVIERPDHSRITCIVNIRPLLDAEGKISGAINCFYDITERKQAEAVQRRSELLTLQNAKANKEIIRRQAVEKSLRVSELNQRGLLKESRELHAQLRHLTRQIITVQEEERKAISRALHDDVMQTLVGINLELTMLGRQATRGTSGLGAKIARTQRLVKNSVASVHRFARDLRPAVLDDFGLIPALQAYVKNLPKPKKLEIAVLADERVETLGSATRAVLFRVAQEALKNVIRHADAAKSTVRITQTNRAVRMEISDNGRAFAVDQILHAKNPKRLGLVGMKERIEMIGGTLTIKSAVRKGTTVRAEFPVPPPLLSSEQARR